MWAEKMQIFQCKSESWMERFASEMIDLSELLFLCTQQRPNTASISTQRRAHEHQTDCEFEAFASERLKIYIFGFDDQKFFKGLIDCSWFLQKFFLLFSTVWNHPKYRRWTGHTGASWSVSVWSGPDGYFQWSEHMNLMDQKDPIRNKKLIFKSI